MLGWRRKRDGFEWHDYVRTTILVRRAKRRQKVDDARAAAADGLKEAGAAAAHSLHEARGAAADGLRRAGEMGQAMGSSGASAARTLLAGAWIGLRRGLAALASATGHGGRALADTAAGLASLGLAPLLDRLADPRTRTVVGAVGATALLAMAYRIWMIGFDRRAAVALLLALLTLLPALLAERRSQDVTHRPAAARPRPRVADSAGAASPWATVHRLGPILGWGAFAAAMVLGIGTLIGPEASRQVPRASTAAITAPVPARPATSSDIEGRAHALSGDTLRIGRRVVRLAHIEAPEPSQTCTRADGKTTWRCGAAARTALHSLIRGRSISCTLSDVGGTVAKGDCRRGDTDLAAALVRDGHVFAETGFFARHTGLEDEARTQHRGLWAGTAERPETFRAAAWEAARQKAPEACPIKGRVAAQAKVYVMPWMPGYDRVTIRPARGERWFCSEEEALKAGWRPAEKS